MNLFSRRKFLVKSALAVAICTMGGVGIYTGFAFDQEVVAQSDSTLTTKNKQTQSQAIAPVALNATTNAATLLVNRVESSDRGSVAMSQEQMARMELPADFVPSNAEGTTGSSPFAQIHLAEFTSGIRAIQALGDSFNAVAKWYGMSSEQLSQLLMTDSTLHVDRKGRLLHIDAGVGSSAATDTANAVGTTTATATTVTGPFPFDQTFKLHSRPGSTRSLYLNFVGSGSNPAFSLDTVPSTFNETEQVLIQKAWQRVSEDYSPFDVDVTTEAPTNTVGKIGAIILVTPQSSSVGGWAYLNSFGSYGVNSPTAFCFPNNLANSEKPIGECLAHELGHTLGLSHQGALPSTEYYSGQGTGDTGWAPIMGLGYYKNLTQWAKGEYANANNKAETYQIMAKQGLNPRPDDHGNTIAFADALAFKNANGFSYYNGNGVIETTGDVDVFRFFSGAGTVNFTVNGAALGSDLDVTLMILDSNGTALAWSNPIDGLSASISANLSTEGNYYLYVTGSGKGSPLTTGYSNYGSLGQYFITGWSPIGLDTPPVVAIAPSTTTGTGPLNVTFNASTQVATGSSIASYEWNYGDGVKQASSTAATSHVYAKTGNFDAVLKVVDSKGLISLKGVKIAVK